jgi:hypothetical protein
MKTGDITKLPKSIRAAEAVSLRNANKVAFVLLGFLNASSTYSK